jgi:hypothetical protein
MLDMARRITPKTIVSRSYIGEASKADGKGVSQGIAPVLRRGAKAMDDLFKAHREASEPPDLPPASSENQTERRNDTDALRT